MDADARLPTRCELHAEKMSAEGWHTTANVLAEAGARIAELEAEVAQLRATIEALGDARKVDRDRSFPCPKCGVERGGPVGGCAQDGCPPVVNERIYALAT